MATNKYRYASENELKETLLYDMRWLYHAHGRLYRLLWENAPLCMLTEERTCWDDMISDVQEILAEGKVRLSRLGKTCWEMVLEEYRGLPSLEEIKDKGLYPKKKSASLPTVDVDVCMAAKDRDEAIDKVWKKYGNNTFLSSDMERMD